MKTKESPRQSRVGEIFLRDRRGLVPRCTTHLNVAFRHAGRAVSVHAKRARGSMARSLAEAGRGRLATSAGSIVRGTDTSNPWTGKCGKRREAGDAAIA
jgi:hypothetical protein